MLRRLFPAVALAFAAANASAQTPPPAHSWQQFPIYDEEMYYNQDQHRAAAKGQSLYFQVNIPAGMKRLRIETIGTNGNADLIVRNGSTTAPVECGKYTAGSNELCVIEAPAAGTRYIEVRATLAFTDLQVIAARLPHFQQITEVPDTYYPHTIGRRTTWWTHPAEVDGCLHVRYPQVGFSLPKQQCMAVGNQQSWTFQARDNHEFRIINTYGERCLTAQGTSVNDPLLDQVCAADDPKQRWTLWGGSGIAMHYVAMKNVATGLCAKLDDGQQMAVQAQCNLEDVDGAPAWSLMWLGRREGATMSDGRLPAFELVGGNRCLADDGNTVFLAECTEKLLVQRLMFPYPSGWYDFWQGTFDIYDVTGSKCLDLEDAGDSLKPVFRECDGVVATQRWKLETNDNHSHEWQLYNVGSKECLMSKDGGEAAGTPVIVGACAPTSRTNKWKYRRD